jgi:hypothetical protein
MCQICGQSNCSCDKHYSFNWYNIDDQPCTSCGTSTVCKKKIPAKCSIYHGAILSALNLEEGANVEEILEAINTLLENATTNKAIQEQKNNTIVAALNDINSRINALAGGTPHADYTI